MKFSELPRRRALPAGICCLLAGLAIVTFVSSSNLLHLTGVALLTCAGLLLTGQAMQRRSSARSDVPERP